MRYYLAIDIGASSGRHIISYLENGKMITEEIYRFQNGPENLTAFDGNEHLMWTHERLFTEILNGLKKAKEIGKIPYSVGIDTWGVDYHPSDYRPQRRDVDFSRKRNVDGRQRCCKCHSRASRR